MPRRARVIGTGSYLPKRVMSNADLSQMIDTSDEWIRSRTGIGQRHVAAHDEMTSDLAVAAARAAIEDANIDAGDIDLIILSTTTPDRTFPATATHVQHSLGASNGPAFDIQAVCTGFIYSLSVAEKFIASGACRTALLIGAETLSRILDWQDRTTCVLFGDGAGALLLQADTQDDTDSSARGILATRLHANGGSYKSLYADGGPSLTQTSGYVRMNGNDIYRQAVDRLAGVSEEILAASNMDAQGIDWFVPHQANLRIMKQTCRRLGLDESKMVSTIEHHANTSAASIPLALNAHHRSGSMNDGDTVLLAAFGGGLTWGGALLRW